MDAAGSAGFTSLIYAARQGHLGIVEVRFWLQVWIEVKL